MKIIFTFLFVVFQTIFLYSQSIIFKPLEIHRYAINSKEEETYSYNTDMSSTSINYYYEKVIDSYNIVAKDSCTWNKDGLLLSKVKSILQNGNWTYKSMNVNEYDSRNNLLVNTSYVWDSLQWKNSHRIKRTYDSNNKMLSYTNEHYENNTWIPIDRQSSTFNKDGYELSLLIEKWENGSWVGVMKSSNVYDDNNNCLTYIIELMEAGNWVKYSRVNYTYNNSGKCLTKIVDLWQSASWQGYEKFEFTYDNNGNEITSSAYTSDITGWRLAVYSLKNYDSNNNLLTSVTEQRNNEIVKSSRRDTYLYNDRNKLVNHLIENRTTGDWFKFYEVRTSYDERDNQTSTTTINWVNNLPVNENRVSTTYNMANYKTQQVLEKWVNETWVIDKITTYGYDSYNNGTYAECVMNNNGVWVGNFNDLKLFYNEGKNIIDGNNFFKLEAKYKSFDLTGVSENNQVVKSFNLLQNYPNPFNPSTTISFELPEESFVELKIYNMIGQEVKTIVNEERSAGTHKFNFNASDLSSGVYFYKIKAKDYSSSRKMMLVK